MPRLFRSFPDSAAFLAPTDDGRTLVGRVVPYGVTATVTDDFEHQHPYFEAFARGALTRTVAERGDRIRLFAGHHHAERHLPIGKAASWEDRADGLYGTFRLADTSAGRDAAELIRDGVASALSIEFDALPHGTRQRADGVVERTEVRLQHVALVTDGAYEGAEVMALRAATDADELDAASSLRRRALALRLRLMFER